MANFQIVYEKESCSRCLGSGHYSYNSISGTRCFRCHGGKQTLTKAGAKAKAAVQAFIAERHTVNVEDLQVGDLIKRDGYTRTVAAIEVSDTWAYKLDGVEKRGVTITYDRPKPGFLGPESGFGTSEGSTIVKGVTGAAWDEVVAFARTIKRGCAVVEKPEPVAQQATAGLESGGAQ
jgi:hypothetical protein